MTIIKNLVNNETPEVSFYGTFQVKVVGIGYEDTELYTIVSPEVPEMTVCIWLNGDIDISSIFQENNKSIIIIDTDTNIYREHLPKVLDKDNCKFVIDISEEKKFTINHNKIINSLDFSIAKTINNREIVESFFESFDCIIVSAICNDFLF